MQKLNIPNLRKACRSSFPAFIRFIAGDDLDDQGFPWLDDFHYDLAKWVENPEMNWKGIILPRGFLKTTVVTQYYAIWRAIRFPDIRVLIVSSSQNNAAQKLELIRATFERNPKFRLLFDYLLPSKRNTRWSNQCVQINRKSSFPEGTFEAAGTGTQVTGRHYDLIIEDDTGAPDISEYGTDQILPPTVETIEKAINWHKQSSPLLINPVTSERIIVGTRWTFYDLMYHVQEHEPDFEFFDRSAVEDGKPTYQRFPLSALEKIRTSMSDYLYYSLYLNKPLPADTMAFHPEQIVWIDQHAETGFGAITVDSAGWKSRAGDEAAVIVCWHSNGFIDVLDSFIFRATPDIIVEKIFGYALDYSITRVLVESDANQYMYAKFIRDESIRRHQLIGIEEVKSGGRSKEQRILGLQPLLQNHQVRFFKTDGNKKLVGQLLQFPFGSHDDGPDALAYHVKVYRGILVPQEKPKYDENYKFNIPEEDILKQIRHWGKSESFGMRAPEGVYFGRN